MKKKIAAIALALALLLCACRAEEEAEETLAPQEPSNTVESTVPQEETVTPLVLACGRNFGESHPSHATEHSRQLLPLIYESLVEVDNSYQQKGGLAEEIQQEGISYTITIKDALFSDGSAIRAADVVNSLEAAMGEGSSWQKQLSTIEEAVVLNARKLRITITEPRRDFINLLDFPICDSDYLGSGQYLVDHSDGKNPKLLKNPNYSGAAQGPDSIALLELANGETLLDSLRIGLISSIFDDLSSGEAMNLSERNHPVEIGHLVFLGVNNREGITASPLVRRAISSALERQQLCDRVYASKATPAETPFHPDFYAIAGHESKNLTLDEERALLEEAGLVRSREGYYRDLTEGEEQDSLTLLYNSDNPYRLQTAELLERQLGDLGLKLELLGLSYKDYMETLEDGDFDLYIGELAIDKTMDVRRLFVPGDGYGYGCESGSNVESVYNSYQQGSSSAGLFLSVYQQNMPAIPLLYRQGSIISKETVAEDFLSRPGTAYGAVLVK